MNWSHFFSMGGYGFYVWGSYLFALVAIGGEVISLNRRRKACAQHADASKVKGSSNNETSS
jgi:heme exporter protein D